MYIGLLGIDQEGTVELRKTRRCEDCGGQMAARRPRRRCRYCRRWLCPRCFARKHGPVMPGDLCVTQAAGVDAVQAMLFDQDAEG